MADIKRRPSIRSDENKGADNEERVQKCKTCNKNTVVSKKGNETKFNNESHQPNLYPDLTNLETCVCKISGVSSDKLDSVSGKSYLSIVWITVAVVLLLVAIVYGAVIGKSNDFDGLFQKKVHNNIDRVTSLNEKLDLLEKKFSNQEEKVWYTLAAGIKSVIRNNPNQPSVFVLLFDNESSRSTAECLAKAVGSVAVEFLTLNSRNSPVILAGSELDKSSLLEDPGRLLVEYNNTIRVSKVMILRNLQDVPAKVATSLHFFCDSYSPLVETAVYIFTLEVDRVPSADSKPKQTEKAREKLSQLWKDKMEDGKFEPLVTRLTPNVLGIKSDTVDC